MYHRLYILDENHDVIPITDEYEWFKWFSHFDRIVATTGNDQIIVSTVFIGINYNFIGEGPPLVFETMVFGGKYDGGQLRYSTWKDAETGHKEIADVVFKMSETKI
jgi:hypothetical protein